MSDASDARSADASGRGTVDLDELERQLRQMAASRPAPRAEDPLADLARLVGRDDPFGGASRSRGAEPVLPVTPAAPEPAPVRDDPLSALERALQAGPRAPAPETRVEPSFAPSPAPEPPPAPSPYAPSRAPAADNLQPAREALEAFLGRGPAAVSAHSFPDEAVPAYRAASPEPETYPADPYQPAPYAIGSYGEPRASEPDPAPYAPPAGNPYGAAYGANAYHASASGGGVSSGAAPAEAAYAPYGAANAAEPEPDFEPFVQRRSRKGLVTVAAVLGVGAIGVALALSLRGGPQTPSGEPPVIRAEGGPARVQPANPGGVDIPNQSKQIYERAANTPQGTPNVVDRSEQPVDLNQVVRSAQPRVVFPGNAPADGSQPAAGSANSGGTDAASGTGQGGIGALLGEPRRVRTVSVRPDGTISGASEPPAGSPAPAATPPSAQRPAAPQANPAPAVVPTTPSGSRPATPAAPATTGSRQGQTGGDLSSLANAATQPLGIGGASTTSGAASSPSVPNAAPPKAQQRVTPPAAAAPRAEPRATEPIAIAPIIAAPAPSRPASPAPAAASSGGGDFMVQLAAPGSEREARDTFAALQRRFAGELGGMSPVIRRVDAGQRTIYRVRVGPMDRAEATALCERLKGGGGQCFVARN